MKKEKEIIIKSNGRPELQMIILPKELEQDEINRNLEKEDCDYEIKEKEKQFFLGEIGKCEAMKYALWSEKKQKYKVFIFI